MGQESIDFALLQCLGGDEAICQSIEVDAVVDDGGDGPGVGIVDEASDLVVGLT